MAKTKEATKKLKQPTKKVRQRNQVAKGEHGGTQVVLVEDVLHVGRQGQVVEVKPGYARNYLIPNGLATIPSEHNKKMLEFYKVRTQQIREARISDLKTLSEQILRTASVNIEANMNEHGDLYGSVGPQEICKAMRGKNLLVEPDMIKIDEQIRHAGAFHVRVALGYEIESSIEVNVVPPTAGKK
jgi:large subunit ribosomal protein L9